jgi:hypothetical protein
MMKHQGVHHVTAHRFTDVSINIFYVKPKINKHDAGLITGKEKGVHDSNYYIEVTVVSKALLKTVVSKKVTFEGFFFNLSCNYKNVLSVFLLYFLYLFCRRMVTLRSKLCDNSKICSVM